MAERYELQASTGMVDARPRLTWFFSKPLQQEIRKLRSALADATACATRQTMLMREADHRIKNNLQIVASFARSVARREQPCAASALRAVAIHVDEIANLHDLLQLSPEANVVDLGDLLHRVRRSLDTLVTVEPRRIEIVLDAEPIMAPAAFARPVMMAVSELVMNAIRHAFPDGRRGTVHVTAAAVDGALRLVVVDDGVGLPSELADRPGFGMTLVRAMVGQIGGTLVAENAPGARFTLVAPLSGG